MPKKPELDDMEVAQVFADAVGWFAERFYCLGAASSDERMAACVDWVERWLVEARKTIAPGTICPSRR